jgi:copper chaperone CopZ
MKDVVIEVPTMYADHHVLRIRQALLATQGVSEVEASAARRRVAVRFDETATSPDAIREALTSAGYPPDQAVAGHQFPKRHQDGSSWHSVLDRKTTTERKDREMAGDFRRY